MSDYPVEVYELLKWFLENPGGKWADVPEGLKEIGWDFIKRDNLHADTGTHHTVPGLSGFGRVVLRDRGKTKPPDADDTEKSKPKQETGNRGKRVNARMLEKMLKDTQAGTCDCHGWTGKQWAAFIKCSVPSVVATQTWKVLKPTREKLKAERAKDRHRRPKGSDQRKRKNQG
jgi:hypothetical protein